MSHQLSAGKFCDKRKVSMKQTVADQLCFSSAKVGVWSLKPKRFESFCAVSASYHDHTVRGVWLLLAEPTSSGLVHLNVHMI